MDPKMSKTDYHSPSVEDSAPPRWPEVITHRVPTEDDGDEEEIVQYLHDGRWNYATWDLVAESRHPWQHTPLWKPRPNRTEVLASLRRCRNGGYHANSHLFRDAILLIEADGLPS
jgi:hypothetical protein